jgi:protein TonB
VSTDDASLYQRLETARNQLAQLELRGLKPQHPDVVRMQRIIADLEQRIAAGNVPPPPPPTAKKVSAAAPVPPDAPAPPTPPPVRKLAADSPTEIAGEVTSGGAPYSPGDAGVKPPVVLSETKPNYTREAMQAKIAGSVGLSCVVETDGTVRDVTVVKSLDPALDGQAILAARRWRFAAGTKDGKPVRVRVSIEMTFTLK